MEINIEIKRSKRKSIALEIDNRLTLIVRLPLKYPEKDIPKLLEKHKLWIEKAINRRKMKNSIHPEPTREEVQELIRKAHEVLPGKIEHFSEITNLTPTGIKITGAKKRFGSCSGKNSLCFSYLLMQYPDECIDYVVLHELSHIKYHNHSKDFYGFLERYMPDYREREKVLKGI